MKKHVIDLCYQAEDCFFRSISKACLDFNESITAYLTGVDTEHDNLICIWKDIEGIDNILNRCADFYKSNNTPWNVVVINGVQNVITSCYQIYYSYHLQII